MYVCNRGSTEGRGIRIQNLPSLARECRETYRLLWKHYYYRGRRKTLPVLIRRHSMDADKPLDRENLERLLREAGSSTSPVLDGCDLRGLDLSGLDLSAVSLYGANLSGANLSRIKLDYAKLSGANLSGADRSSANLSQVDLSGADLSGANLTDAYLVRANLHNADLREAILIGTYLDGADLRGANLVGVDLEQADLSGVDLRQANMGAVELDDINPGPSGGLIGLFRGRINRRSYIVGGLMGNGAAAFLGALWIASRLLSISSFATVVLLLALMGAVVFFQISLIIRRFHDLNRGAVSLLWLFVPFFNVYFGFLLLFGRGTIGWNRYGPPPLPAIRNLIAKTDSSQA